MSNVTDESEILREILIAEAEAHAGGHPGVDALASYQEGSLEAEAEERVRDHLVGCQSCAEQLLELQQLMRPEAPREGVADLEIESAWRRFQALAGPSQASTATVARRGWVQALAASLAVAALLLGLWSLRLKQANESLRQQLGFASLPTVNMPVLYLDGARRAAAGREYRLELPGSAGRFALFFAVGGALPADEYEVRFLDPDGEPVLDQGGLVMNELGGLRLGLPSALLAPGEYRVLLRGRWADDWREVEEYRLTITYR